MEISNELRAAIRKRQGSHRQVFVEELNQSADEYFARLMDWDRHLAKPFTSSNDAIHLLVRTSYLLQGLELIPECVSSIAASAPDGR